MLPGKKPRIIIGVGFGLVLQVAGSELQRTKGDPQLVALGYLGWLVGVGLIVWGCMSYAEAKGHSKSLGWFGILSCLGVIALFCLPDRCKGGWKFLAKPPEGVPHEYTLDQLRQEFLSGKISREWVAHRMDESDYRPISEVLGAPQ